MPDPEVSLLSPRSKCEFLPFMPLRQYMYLISPFLKISSVLANLFPFRKFLHWSKWSSHFFIICHLNPAAENMDCNTPPKYPSLNLLLSQSMCTQVLKIHLLHCFLSYFAKTQSNKSNLIHIWHLRNNFAGIFCMADYWIFFFPRALWKCLQKRSANLSDAVSW